ncbi:alpha/beta fold hydrolase [Streptomyces sp. NPDC018833]|uniref:alpha/beta fold hydrolase n=1 Tax=Streptomyces sp. NPDC018833 TaxID=3365053 RepID=UPI0037B4907A
MNPAYATVDHVFTVPLDHEAPDGPAIEIFAREVADLARAGEQLPWLLYLQGGPGGKSPRPSAGSPGWLPQALKTHRVLLLDQRGTGRSTPVTARSASRFPSSAELAAHLAHFRADAIVADAELIRRRLCGDDTPWETLGQSYGGFITLTYLSQAPEGLRACYVTGGLPGLTATADDVYARTYPRVRDRVLDFYARYPDDAPRLRKIADLLAAGDVRLPEAGPRARPKCPGRRRIEAGALPCGAAPPSERVQPGDWALRIRGVGRPDAALALSAPVQPLEIEPYDADWENCPACAGLEPGPPVRAPRRRAVRRIPCPRGRGAPTYGVEPIEWGDASARALGTAHTTASQPLRCRSTPVPRRPGGAGVPAAPASCRATLSAVPTTTMGRVSVVLPTISEPLAVAALVVGIGSAVPPVVCLWPATHRPR